MCDAVRENKSNSPGWESLQMSGCKCLMKGRSRGIDGICFCMPVCVMKTQAQACQLAATRGSNHCSAAGTPGAAHLKDRYKKSNHSQRKSQEGME